MCIAHIICNLAKIVFLVAFQQFLGDFSVWTIMQSVKKVTFNFSFPSCILIFLPLPYGVVWDLPNQVWRVSLLALFQILGANHSVFHFHIQGWLP